MNTFNAPENGENNIDIKEIGFGPMPDKIRAILNELPNENQKIMLEYLQGNREHYMRIFENMEQQYVDLENKVNANTQLQDNRAVVNQQAFEIVDEPMSPEDLQARVKELLEENGVLKQEVVKAKKETEEERQKREKAEKDGVIDGLTQISNRKGLDIQFPKLIKQVHRNETKDIKERGKIALIIFDIDHFKKFNDTYGHLAGDAVLIEMGKLLQNSLFRETDYIARYGGEEFAVILENCDLENAKMKAESFQKALQELLFKFENTHTKEMTENIPVTVSMGVTSVHLPSDKVFDKTLIDNIVGNMIKVADQQMYEVKNNGRNNVSGKQINYIEAARPVLAYSGGDGVPQNALDFSNETPDRA